MLREKGHDVAAHAHNLNDTPAVLSLFETACGLDPPRTASGYNVWFKEGGDALAKAWSAEVQQLVTQGIRVGTTSIAPDETGHHDMAPTCTTTWGEGNTSWSQGTDNLMFPWKPDYANNRPCDHDPEGQFVLIDHTVPEWVVGSGGKADTLRTEHFDQLKTRLQAALEYMDKEQPERIAVWGLVTHITEYMVGSKADNGPNEEALQALDSFLDFVDQQVSAGRMVYSTPENLAAELFPEVL